MQIHQAQHGINLVVETGDTVYIGRFDQTNAFQALLHDCAIHPIAAGEDPEDFVRSAARYGFAVDRRDVQIDVAGIRRVRVLGDVPKD